MLHGDFTELAKFYINRPGYSRNLLSFIANTVGAKRDEIIVADVGAGTGKLTSELDCIGLKGWAVEPNDAMREEGIRLFSGRNTFAWMGGSAENTGLPDNSVDWVTMGSSFHWADTELALKEFHRILKPNGFFTAIWNPRDIEKSSLHMKIESVIYERIPHLQRVSSGAKTNMKNMDELVLSTAYFENLIFAESPHIETMTKERYMGIWKSVNDIRVQAGEENFKCILAKIEKIIENFTEIIVPYKSRAWTIQSTKNKV